MHDKVIYDWLSITSKIHSFMDMMRLIGIAPEHWTNTTGAKGYKRRWYYEKISIHYDGSDDMGIFLEMSGQGCRAFETYGTGNYEYLFNLVESNAGKMKITRLDVAYDDFDGVLDMATLCEDTTENNFVSRFNDWQVIQGSKGASITHGSMKSEFLIRIYDKAAERGYTDGRHWVRVEIQMRRDRAMKFAYMPEPIGVKFSGVLINYLRYVEDDTEDCNKWRWPIRKYWADLLGNAYKISLYEKPGVEYNLSMLESFVVKQAGNAIDTYIKIFGVDGFLKDISQRGIMMNPKYTELIEQYCNREVG